MNTVGKILVILNFLFAIVVGVLVVLNAGLNSRLKDSYDRLLNEANALKQARDLDKTIHPKVRNDFKNIVQAKQEADQKLKDREDEFKVLIDQKEIQLADQINRAKAADQLLNAANATIKRHADEIALLNTTITDREKAIVKMEAESKVLLVNVTNFQAMNNALKIRNESLIEQLREKEKQLVKLQAGVNPEADIIANPSQPNPPAVAINGKIELVDGDLVQVSLGTDHGLNRNNTLDVYRVKPAPKYLGMIRIVDAKDHSSVGRLVPMGNAAFRPQLIKGDLVTSKITR